MKKNCLLFIFIFLGIVLFKIDGVRAKEITIIFSECNKFSFGNGSYTINNEISDETPFCCDDNFDHWIVGTANKDGSTKRLYSEGFLDYNDSGKNLVSLYNGFTNNMISAIDDGYTVYIGAVKSDTADNHVCDGLGIDINEIIHNHPVEDSPIEDKPSEERTTTIITTPTIVCTDYKTDTECKRNKCSWNKEYGFCSNDGLTYLKCGDANDFPSIVPKLSSYAVTLLKTVTPVVLIIFSIISLVKAMTSSKEEDIKKAQAGLIKRIIISALIFFVITIVQFIMLKVASSAEKDNLSSCLSCLLNGTSDCGSIYYKSGSGKCFYVKGGEYDCD